MLIFLWWAIRGGDPIVVLWLDAGITTRGEDAELSPPFVDWISYGTTNWADPDPDPFVSHAEKSGPEFLKIFCTHVLTS